MKLQNLTVIFIIIIIPIILLETMYITTGIKTLKYQSLYDDGLITATHDAIYAFEMNTQNNDYSENPEIKREILKSSVKMLEKSLCNTCGISTYKAAQIEEYIPAILFGMYDGFYLYAASSVPNYDDSGNFTGYKYEHSLRNYVYYSEELDDGTIIKYSLDNHVTVSGDFRDLDGLGDLKYRTFSGYLIDLNKCNIDGKKYKDVAIVEESIDGETNIDAIQYYKDAYTFTNWFVNIANIDEQAEYFDITKVGNDPEDENSLFAKHKQEIIKNKVQGILNSTITAYSKKTWGKTYKMPKLSEEDWEKIYTNVSIVTFLQGKSIGLTNYNGYCVLNSTNSNEYVNPNLMYFVDDTRTYHDIRCPEIKDTTTQLYGYKIGDFQKKKVTKTETNPITGEETIKEEYEYKHKDDLACYECINGKRK